MDKITIISKIKSFFLSKANICAVYLFGSVAKNKDRKDSDVDIAVLFNDNLDSFERFDSKLSFANDLEDLLETKIDIVDLNSADPFFIHQVMLSKTLVLDNNTTKRVSFEVNQRKKYFDMQPFFEFYHNQALKRLEEM